MHDDAMEKALDQALEEILDRTRRKGGLVVTIDDARRFVEDVPIP